MRDSLSFFSLYLHLCLNSKSNAYLYDFATKAGATLSLDEVSSASFKLVDMFTGSVVDFTIRM